MQTQDLIFLAILGAFVVYMIFRVSQYGGFRGVIYGAKIAQTIGEIDLGSQAGTRKVVRVYVLENGNMVVEEASRSLFSASLHGILLSREHAMRLSSLLHEASDTSAVGSGPG